MPALSGRFLLRRLPRPRRLAAQLWGIVVALSWLAGCADFKAPDYVRPEVPGKAAWSRQGSVTVSPEETIVPNWWQAFRDPYLDSLVNRAIAGNYDIKLLAARIQVAGAQIAEARAGALPVFDVGAGASFEKSTGSKLSKTYNVAAQVNWEIDVWGKVAKGVQAQQAEFSATEADWRAGYLTLVSGVSTTYFQILQFDEQLEQQKKTLARNRQILTTYGAMYQNGLVPKVRVMQQQAEINGLTKDLIELARRGGDEPLVWVLPVDLPKLDLGATLKPEAFADVLAHVVSVSEEHRSTRDLSFDNAILERVLEVLGENATIAQVTAALRALAQVGDPRDDLKCGLITAAQLERIGTLFGRGVSDRVVIERAWALESQLRKLESLGTEAVRLPPARLRVVSMDRQAGVFGNRVLGTYVATALTHILRQSPASDRPWYHTIIVAGADKLRGDVLDRLMDSCETSRTGLVLTYRSLTPTVRERLGRGHAAVAFMRLGNAEDARVASEHVGTEHRLELAQLTETISDSVDGLNGNYTSTIDQHAEEGEYGRGESTTDLAGDITESTEWGRTSNKIGETERVLQRSREFLVEPHRLQQLPTTSVIVTDATGSGRRVRLADANPAILTFPKTTLGSFEDVREAILAVEEKEPAEQDGAPPNLGPPPPRLDWRKPR